MTILVASGRRTRPRAAARRLAVSSGAVLEPRAWDRSMAERIRVGDDGALAAVYDRYGALVHGIARQLVGGERAKDVTQEVFLHLWQHAASYDADAGGLGSYLSVIARRRAIDELRAAGRRAAREERAATAAPDDPPSVEAQAMAGISAGRVRTAMQRLPDEQRRAVELAYFEGLTFRDVAEATGAAEGTAKSRLRLALGRLARELAKDVEGARAWN